MATNGLDITGLGNSSSLDPERILHWGKYCLYYLSPSNTKIFYLKIRNFAVNLLTLWGLKLLQCSVTAGELRAVATTAVVTLLGNLVVSGIS